MDKRFWGGAIILATIVVAGASTLPALLLRVSSDEPETVIPRVPTREEAVQPPVTASLTGSEAVKEPAPETVPQASVSAIPAEVPQAAAFPPVQPVGLPAGTAERSATALSEPSAPPAATATPVATKSQHPVRSAAARETKRKRHVVRPALYPIREFFAWRR